MHLLLLLFRYFSFLFFMDISISLDEFYLSNENNRSWIFQSKPSLSLALRIPIDFFNFILLAFNLLPFLFFFLK